MRLNQLHPYNKNVSPNCDVLTESCSLIDNVQQMYIKRDESEVMENKCQLSASILDFITKCMSVQISKRPSIEQLMLHPFFKD